MSTLVAGMEVLFAQAEGSTALRAIEFDWPREPWQWALYGGCIVLVILFTVGLYVRDTVDLGRFWKFWLTGLRLALIAALVVIALNPQERTQKMAHRPSRVAVLVDTSLSMRYPQQTASAEDPESQNIEAVSRADAVSNLLADSQLISELRDKHEVSVYTFDSSLIGPEHVFRTKTPADENGVAANQADGDAAAEADDSIDWEELLRPRGVETRLGESLVDLIRQVSGRTLSGLVVFTDGGSNAGIEAETANEVAKTSKTRLVTIGVGSTQPPVNLRVVNIQGPTDVHLGDDYEITAFVQGQGLSGRELEVELLMRPEGEDSNPFPVEADPRKITLAEDGVPTEVTFRQTPSVAGSVEFFVRARSTTNVQELTTDDNERRKTVNIVERKTRVLLIAGGPMRDYRFVRNMLYRHGAVSTDVWLQTVLPESAAAVSQESENLLMRFPSTAAELFEYDVIVAFDPDWSQIAAEQLNTLAEWVSRHAGGLILVAGDVYTPELAGATEERKSLLELYPVFLSTYVLGFQLEKEAVQPWPVELTEAGQQAGFLQLTETDATTADVWKEFPGMYRCYPTAGAKAGATIYAYFSDPRSQPEESILLASQFYGAGRTMYLGSAETWRLRSLDDEYYERLWTNLVREVGQGRLRRGTSRGMVMLERDQYVLGQTVRVRVNLLDPQLEPFDAPSVPMEVFDPNGRPMVPARRLQLDENRPGQYVGDFRAGMPGTYRMEIPVPESSEQLVSKVDVVVPNLESDNPRQNASLLTDLVRDTGGQYLTLAEAEVRLPALLPNQSEDFMVDERLRTLWDRQWVLYLLVGLLAVEWLTRKLLKLA